ncbi:hypothetical protein TNCV_4966961 [Trichonephila clavipes]|nr:hypothetical protein TNCV_4966961 [Trichonephila clavipes]
MASIEQWFFRRLTAPETHTVKRAFRSPFTDCMAGTVIQLCDLENPSCLRISGTEWPLRRAPTIGTRSKASKSGSLPVLVISTTDSEQP